MSPRTISTSSPASGAGSALGRIIARTRSPRARSWRQRLLPRCPLAPVTSVGFMAPLMPPPRACVHGASCGGRRLDPREGHLYARRAMAAEIARRTGLEVDVCRLEVAGPVLAYEIVTGGRRVFARDEEAADLREERVRREYLDTAYLRRVQHHYLYGDPL